LQAAHTGLALRIPRFRQEVLMSGPENRTPHGPRTIALVGPYGSGKTALLESIAQRTGAGRKGASAPASGDTAAEARGRQMGLEVAIQSARFLGEDFTFLDCPGSIEFFGETLSVLPGIDAAVVVCEPDHGKTGMVQPYLKALSDAKIPHFIFVNKFDKANGSLRGLLALLQQESTIPLLLRQIPIWENGAATGFIDLALERAFSYDPGLAGKVIAIADVKREKDARFQMLERLADYDEHLMEELLGDVEPSPAEVFGDLSRELGDCLVVPVLIGSAALGNGVERLLKALRHEVQDVARAAVRNGIKADADATVQVLKTMHGAQGGKLSLVRVLAGHLRDNQILHGPGGEMRIGGIFAISGNQPARKAEAGTGETVALARMAEARTGERLSADRTLAAPAARLPLAPVYRLAIEVTDRKDEVKATAALARLMEEDPSLAVEHDAGTQQMVLAGQGEIHLKLVIERLTGKYGLGLSTHAPAVPYRETIRRSATSRGRHKRQSGGHGQFGDVMLEIRPNPRGAGFAFQDRIKGGVVPKQWIGSVEKGVMDYMRSGPLGFPVVDVAVALTDGSYHSVDSSDAAFQMAGRLAMSEGMPGCEPVLLEPMMKLSIHVPHSATAKVASLVGARRGMPLGFDSRQGWSGWDTVWAEIPQSEVSDLIVDLRSLTQGVGTYDMEFSRLAELNGKLAESVVAARKAA
jgi:elongation factor G